MHNIPAEFCAGIFWGWQCLGTVGQGRARGGAWKRAFPGWATPSGHSSPPHSATGIYLSLNENLFQTQLLYLTVLDAREPLAHFHRAQLGGNSVEIEKGFHHFLSCGQCLVGFYPLLRALGLNASSPPKRHFPALSEIDVADIKAPKRVCE